MSYKCELCGEVVEADLKEYIDHTEDHIIEIIKQKHPEWVQKDGMCHKCVEYFRQQMKGPGH